MSNRQVYVYKDKFMNNEKSKEQHLYVLSINIIPPYFIAVISNNLVKGNKQIHEWQITHHYTFNHHTSNPLIKFHHND